jgi:hypothetical protein
MGVCPFRLKMIILNRHGGIVIDGVPVSHGKSSWLEAINTPTADDYKSKRLPDGVLEAYRICIERGDNSLRPHGYDDYIRRRQIAATTAATTVVSLSADNVHPAAIITPHV